MSTIRMISPINFTGNITLPAPSLAQVAVTNGLASVQAKDVQVAIQHGWSVMNGEAWPAARVAHLSAPANGAWPTSGTMTLPDGSTVAITGPVGSLGAIADGSGYTNGTYSQTPLTGGNGNGALATIVVAGGVVTSVTLSAGGVGYSTADTLSASALAIGSGGSGFAVPVATLSRSDALIPAAWVDKYRRDGWSATPYVSGADG